MKQNRTYIPYFAGAVLTVCALMRPLEEVWIRFKWTDELLCFGAFLVGALLWLPKKELRRQMGKHLLYFIPLFVYLFMQLLGSVKFQFQPWSAVVIDGITNAKFWLGLYGCYLIGRLAPEKAVDKGLLVGAKAISAVLFVLFVFERFRLGVTGGGDTMWGIPYATIIYGEPTYLASTMVLMLAVFLAQWEKKSIPYVLADLLMLCFTFRSKAFGAGAVFLGVLVFVVLWRQRVKIWHIAVAGVAVLGIGWNKIAYYFLDNQHVSPRYLMLTTSIRILKDYFPFGTGFGSFGSHQAVVHYSPLYTMYGFEDNFYLNSEYRKFMDDTFWPIVLAQSGAIGLCAFAGMLFLLVRKAWVLIRHDYKKYGAALFCIAYCLIDTLAEASFNHVATIPLALLMGCWFGTGDREEAE